MVFLVESRIENHVTGRKIKILGKSTALGCAMESVHPSILPLNGQRSRIGNVVQSDDDFLEIRIPAAYRTKLPETARVGEVRMATKDAHTSISVPPPRILHMDVEDPVREVTDELDVVNPLVAEVTGVIIKSKS